MLWSFFGHKPHGRACTVRDEILSMNLMVKHALLQMKICTICPQVALHSTPWWSAYLPNLDFLHANLVATSLFLLDLCAYFCTFLHGIKYVLSDRGLAAAAAFAYISIPQCNKAAQCLLFRRDRGKRAAQQPAEQPAEQTVNSCLTRKDPGPSWPWSDRKQSNPQLKALSIPPQAHRQAVASTIQQQNVAWTSWRLVQRWQSRGLEQARRHLRHRVCRLFSALHTLL